MPVVINEFEVLSEPVPGSVAAAAGVPERAPAPTAAALQPLLEQLAREAREREQRVQEL
jgi:hypothetical protein